MGGFGVNGKGYEISAREGEKFLRHKFDF